VFKSVAFIVNPVAGSAKLGRIVAELSRRLTAAGGRSTILKTAGPGHAVELSRGVGEDIEAIVAVGGDGTVREVAAGRLDRPLPLLILPAGTENLLARHLGIVASVECLWDCLTQGVVRPFDIGFVNGRCFLIVAGAGFDAEVVGRLARTRRGHITRGDYFWPLWRTFWEYRFPPIHVMADGQTLFQGRGLAFVGNIAHYGMGLRILRDARDHDGLLDVCVYPCSGRGRLLVHSCYTAVRRHVERPDVIYRRARRVRIESSAPLALEADGDLAGALPAELAVLPSQAQFCVAEGYPELP